LKHNDSSDNRGDVGRREEPIIVSNGLDASDLTNKKLNITNPLYGSNKGDAT